MERRPLTPRRAPALAALLAAAALGAAAAAGLSAGAAPPAGPGTRVGLAAGPEHARARRAPQPPARSIALTFDDLPLVHGPSADAAVWERITGELLAPLAARRLPAVGFVNEHKLVAGGRVEPRRVALLQRWIDAGLELGNHTWSHPDLHTTPAAEFAREIVRGDSVTRSLLARSGARPRWFRHPFLHTGRDSASRAHVDSTLAVRGYRVAPVTVDNYDYIFARAWAFADARGDTAGAGRIAAAYVDYMERVLDYYERTSAVLFGREIPQVLLLHANALNARTVSDLAAMMERRGYAFIPLEAALSDTAYATPDRYFGPAGMTWLHRWALTAGRRDAILPGEPVVPGFVERAAR